MDLVSLPSLLAIPNSFGAPPSALQPGEIVDALVLALLDNGLVRLQVPDGTIDVRTAVPLAVGAKVRLAVSGTSAGLQVVVLTDGSGRGGTPATIVARQGAEAPARPAPEPASAAAGSEPAVEIALSGAPPAPPAAGPVLTPATESVAAAVQAAASRQGGLAPLLADLEQAVKTEMLPQPLAAVAARLLDARLSLDGVSAAGLRQALARSGVFLEASLAASLPGDATPPQGFDLKAALVVLRQMLKAWAEGEPRIGSAGFAPPASAPPPPYRGAPPSAQPASGTSLPAYAPAGAVAQRLLAETDGALARHTLLQVASLPEGDAGSHAAVRTAQWAFEVPLAMGQGSAIAQFEIMRDGHAAGAEPSFTWRVRFSVNVEPMGPVHALIALAGGRAAVTLWAEREESAAHLRANSGLLEEALRAASLDPRDIQFRVGAPAPPPSAAGRFLDRAS
jgi:Flagellar hook-length control protein FliK